MIVHTRCHSLISNSIILLLIIIFITQQKHNTSHIIHVVSNFTRSCKMMTWCWWWWWCVDRRQKESYVEGYIKNNAVKLTELSSFWESVLQLKLSFDEGQDNTFSGEETSEVDYSIIWRELNRMYNGPYHIKRAIGLWNHLWYREWLVRLTAVPTQYFSNEIHYIERISCEIIQGSGGSTHTYVFYFMSTKGHHQINDCKKINVFSLSLTKYVWPCTC